jgi:hypothetical protein
METEQQIVETEAEVRISPLRVFWKHETRLSIPEPIQERAVWHTETQSVCSPSLTQRDAVGNYHDVTRVWVYVGSDRTPLLTSSIAKYSLRSFIHSSIHQWNYSPLLGPGLFLVSYFFIQAARRKAATYTQIQNNRRQTSMPWMGFDRAATVIGKVFSYWDLFYLVLFD